MKIKQPPIKPVRLERTKLRTYDISFFNNLQEIIDEYKEYNFQDVRIERKYKYYDDEDDSYTITVYGPEPIENYQYRLEYYEKELENYNKWLETHKDEIEAENIKRKERNIKKQIKEIEQLEKKLEKMKKKAQQPS